MTEDLLIVHEQELNCMRDYYEQNKGILEKISKRQQLWTEFLELEVGLYISLSGYLYSGGLDGSLAISCSFP
jgi:Microtubule associated protein (MAP65/ASE1 family)